jgi:hypothetical protein
MTDATAIEPRDVTEQVASAIAAGRSLRLIRKDFSLSEGELDQALEKLWPVNNDARIRNVKHDLARLERIIEMLMEKTIAGDINAAAVLVKALDRKSQLLGLDAAQQIDLQVIRPPEFKSQHNRIKEAIDRLWEQTPQVEKDIHERVKQLGNRRALELLGPLEPTEPTGNGNGSDHS